MRSRLHIDHLPIFCLRVLLLIPFVLALTDVSGVRCPIGDILATNTTLPTPTYGTGNLTDPAVFTVCTEQDISAPIALVYDTLLDFKSYHLWNSFVIEVVLPPNVVKTPEDVYIGMSMNFTSQGLVPGQNSSSTEVIRILDPPSSSTCGETAVSAWGSNGGVPGLLAEHPNALTQLEGPDGQDTVLTRYVSWETYYGAGAVALEAIRPPLQQQFVNQGSDLKRFVEGL